MSPLDFTISKPNFERVWRVGRAPDPWAWVEPQFAGQNRWDDAEGFFRTIYVGQTLLACFLEVLAFARPDLDANGEDPLRFIHEDPEDRRNFPVPKSGVIPREWISTRMVGHARLDGKFVDVRTAPTIAQLRPRFLRVARALGFPDLDAAALKNSNARALTQSVATYLYGLVDSDQNILIDGVCFASRHGDELTIWAIFERPGETISSGHLQAKASRLVQPDEPELIKAMAIHQLVLGK